MCFSWCCDSSLFGGLVLVLGLVLVVGLGLGLVLALVIIQMIDEIRGTCPSANRKEPSSGCALR